MAKIITPSPRHLPPPPWYLRDLLTCPKCACRFRCDEEDFEGTDGMYGHSPTWFVHEHIETHVAFIEGKCPDCGETIRINEPKR